MSAPLRSIMHTPLPISKYATGGGDASSATEDRTASANRKDAATQSAQPRRTSPEQSAIRLDTAMQSEHSSLCIAIAVLKRK